MTDVVIVPDAPSALLINDGVAAVVYMNNLGAPSAAAAAASAAAAAASETAAEAAQAAAEVARDDAIEQVDLAEDQVTLATAQAVVSANSATLSAEARDASIAAKLLSETAAGAAGAYLDAVEVLVDGAPLVGTLTMQAATRAILTAFTGMSAGAQVYLGEPGYTGPFIFVGGDQSANITADTYGALWLAPDTDTTGASGAWKRIHYGLAQATWAGVVATGIGDYAARITALLAHADVWVVELPAGTIGVASSIPVPSGKQLIGKGIDATILKATASATYSAGSGTFHNSIVHFPTNSIAARIRDFTVNGNKLGSHVIGGVHAIRSTKFVTERIRAINCSAYAFWALTNLDYTPEVTSGVFRNCWAENCNVSFETTAAQNILFDRCHARQGDGDILPNIETMFHPISGSKHITFRDCTGVATTAGTVAHVAAYTAEPVEDITFENCDFRHTTDGIGVAVTAFLEAVRGVRFLDTDIESADYFGVNAVDASGPYGIDMSFQGGKVIALAQGIISDSVDGTVDISGTHIVMRHTSGAGAVAPVNVVGNLILNGPIFDTDGAFDYPQSFPQNAIITAAPAVLVEPPTNYPPMGIGHTVRRILSADEAHNAGAALVGSGFNSFNMIVDVAGTYKVHVEGSYSTSATSNSIALQVDGSADMVRGQGLIHGHADGSLSKHGIFTSTLPTTFGSGDGVTAINTPYPFTATFVVQFDAGGGNSSFNIGPYISDGAGFGGSSSIKAGTVMTIERVA